MFSEWQSIKSLPAPTPNNPAVRAETSLADRGGYVCHTSWADIIAAKGHEWPDAVFTVLAVLGFIYAVAVVLPT